MAKEKRIVAVNKYGREVPITSHIAKNLEQYGLKIKKQEAKKEKVGKVAKNK